MKECPQCKKQFTKPKNKFCGSSCAATYNNLRKPRRAKRNPCLNCGEPCKTAVAKYCSNQCQADLKWAKTKQKIEDSGKILTTSTSKQGRKYLLEKRGKSCEICGDTHHTFYGEQVDLPLILDHIDGNSDNWKLTNLRLVCGRCDMLLPTYKSKNRGSGRHYRRERYAEGKSY